MAAVELREAGVTGGGTWRDNTNPGLITDLADKMGSSRLQETPL